MAKRSKLMEFKLQFNYQTNKGFTLIEIMVATLILFSSIATVSMVYSGAFISSEKANHHVVISGVIPALLANIRTDIRSKGNSTVTSISHSGKVLEVKFSWKAQLISHKSAPKKLDVDGSGYVTPPLKYKLWQVHLNLKLLSTKKHYQFYEVSWSDD